jgi:predicted DCC family thiol-disulfide oxidoreductase YuxK
MTSNQSRELISIAAARDMANGDQTCSAHALKVYYDGACPLCQREIAHYRSIDRAGQVEFVDLTKDGAETGPDLRPEDALARFHVRDANGQLMSGAQAFLRLWEELPGWRWLAPVAKVPGVTWLLERAYRGFLPLRPRIQKLFKAKR